MTATFEIPGVRKQDMHVSFRSRCLVVSWVTMKVTEKREGQVLVRDREERKCSHTLPLPEGTGVSGRKSWSTEVGLLTQVHPV